jgi:hypothetical protein
VKDRHQDPPAGGTEERQALAAPHSGITDDRLLDYLYDELDEADRDAFEREMRADPSLMREVEEHRRTRQSFARLMTDPMPAGVLDGVLEAADAQAAAFATRDAPRVGWWQRLIEGLKGLAFQPAFAMGLIFLLVGGIALYSSRDPKDMPGMGPPTDVQRLPPVAMAPAREEASAGGERAKNEEAQAEVVASANLRLEQEPSVADGLAQGALYAAEARVDQPRPTVARPTDSSGLLDKRAPTGGQDWDTGVGGRPDPVTTTLEDRLAEADSRAKERETKPAARAATVTAGAPKADDGPPPVGRAGATGEAAQGATEPRQQPEPATAPDSRRAPQVAEAPKAAPAEPAPRPQSEGSADDEAERQAGAKKANEESKATEKVAEVVADRAERARDSEPTPYSQPAATQNAKAPANKGASRSGIDDVAKDVPSAPPMKTEDSAKPAAPTTPAPPTPERLWSTLGQQMAAGALTDAQRTLSELVKVEGESARVKAARDELAKALAKAQPKPADTKPLPEPAKPTP